MDDIVKYFKYGMLFPIIVSFIVGIIIIPVIATNGHIILEGDNLKENINMEFEWPTPGFNKISSYFGKRVSPTAGASSYHKGIDIPAYQGSKVLSISEGIVIFSGFSSTGGCMVKIQHSNGIQSSYCHLGEKIFVKKGDKILKGETLGTVGPKYLSNGKLNGATTGVHLHFSISKDGKAVDPLNFY